jgi:cell division protein FtsB
MKFLIIILTGLFFILQYKLWIAPEGLWRLRHLKQDIAQQQMENQRLSLQNEQLGKEIQDLKVGRAALENHARQDLNMIKPDELFYFIVEKEKTRTAKH